MTAPGESPISYADFGSWYDTHRSEVLEPALARASESLERAFVEVLSDRDRARIRTMTGRIKSKRRTWRKLHHARYVGQVSAVEDIPAVVDDLVGLRVTCINLRDIDIVVTALDGLERASGANLWVDPASERDYLTEPKDSGYRGWHVNLWVRVGGRDVVCELQVRTLLQDSWGELTHQDAYSKDGALPPLVGVLGTRMADLLAILDDIAEDIRIELDRLDQEAVAADDLAGAVDDELVGVADDAASLLRARWAELDRPIGLASLAWELQTEFGAEVSDDWFGHGSFKRFLRHAVPDGEISTGRQAFLLPGAEAAASDESAVAATDPSAAAVDSAAAPGALRQLRRIDPEFPPLTAEAWAVLFEQLANAWRRIAPADGSARTASRLARSASDRARSAGSSLSRRHVEYVARTILLADNGAGRVDQVATSGPHLAQVFADRTIERLVELRILDEGSRRAAGRVERFLVGTETSG